MKIETTFNTKIHAYSIRIKGLGGFAITTQPKHFRGVTRTTSAIRVYGFGLQLLVGNSKAWRWS